MQKSWILWKLRAPVTLWSLYVPLTNSVLQWVSSLLQKSISTLYPIHLTQRSDISTYQGWVQFPIDFYFNKKESKGMIINCGLSLKYVPTHSFLSKINCQNKFKSTKIGSLVKHGSNYLVNECVTFQFPSGSSLPKMSRVIIQLINKRTWVEIALHTFRMPERCC